MNSSWRLLNSRKCLILIEFHRSLVSINRLRTVENSTSSCLLPLLLCTCTNPQTESVSYQCRVCAYSCVGRWNDRPINRGADQPTRQKQTDRNTCSISIEVSVWQFHLRSRSRIMKFTRRNLQPRMYDVFSTVKEDLLTSKEVNRHSKLLKYKCISSQFNFHLYSSDQKEDESIAEDLSSRLIHYTAYFVACCYF